MTVAEEKSNIKEKRKNVSDKKLRLRFFFGSGKNFPLYM